MGREQGWKCSGHPEPSLTPTPTLRALAPGKREEPGSADCDLSRRSKHLSKANLLPKSRKGGYFGLIFHFRRFTGKF